MGRLHHITPAQRAQLAGQMLNTARPYGAVTQLSRSAGVSRQTLYAWRDRGQAALRAAFQPAPAAAARPDLARAILTLLVEGHASERGIQGCLQQLGYGLVSLGTISAIITEAEQRAQA